MRFGRIRSERHKMCVSIVCVVTLWAPDRRVKTASNKNTQIRDTDSKIVFQVVYLHVVRIPLITISLILFPTTAPIIRVLNFIVISLAALARTILSPISRWFNHQELFDTSSASPQLTQHICGLGTRLGSVCKPTC